MGGGGDLVLEARRLVVFLLCINDEPGYFNEDIPRPPVPAPWLYGARKRREANLRFKIFESQVFLIEIIYFLIHYSIQLFPYKKVLNNLYRKNINAGDILIKTLQCNICSKSNLLISYFLDVKWCFVSQIIFYFETFNNDSSFIIVLCYVCIVFSSRLMRLLKRSDRIAIFKHYTNVFAIDKLDKVN